MEARKNPSLLSRARLTTLLASILVALGSGTNYVYSAYSPQLGARLRINHTKQNVVGEHPFLLLLLPCSSLRLLISRNSARRKPGPILGRLVDRRGPAPLLVGAFVFLSVGYFGIRHFYLASSGGTEAAFAEPIGPLAFAVLTFCSLLTGLGGNAGLTSAMNTTAKSFPDRARATANGIVISGFGLSAFFFSSLAHVLFPGDAGGLLTLLAFGTSLPMVLGYFLVRPVPHDEDTEIFSPVVGPGIYTHESRSQTPLLGEDETASVPFLTERSRPVEMSPTRWSDRPIRPKIAVRDIHGKRLFFSWEFSCLVLILALCSGTGLMFINNIGSITQALVAQGDPDFDELEASRRQATQVSVISLMNFAGRILAGVVADYIRSVNRPRSYCLSLVSALFVLSQLVAKRITEPDDLWQASASLGLAYGALFGLFPTMCIDWFGMAHFSENWGFVSLAPALGGNLFSLAFGRNLDAHAGENDQCLAGRECYTSSITMTAVACTIALMFSIAAGWYDRRRELRNLHRDGTVLWDAGDHD